MAATSRALLAALAALVPACAYSERGFQPPACLGEHVLAGVCLQRVVPDGTRELTGAIDTATKAAGQCTEIVPHDPGPPLCVIAAAELHISRGATLRATAQRPMGAVGSNPLVLLATDSIVIDGTLDVSSGAGQPMVGAGARRAADCAAAAVIDGHPGESLSTNPASAIGGGGGAGGSFGTPGASGGAGGNGTHTTMPGQARAEAAFTGFAGGCPGGKGGDGYTQGGTGAPGGAGGGAVYLVAGGMIAIAGTINASGAGGDAGVRVVTGNMGSSSGGGGGGAGGMIALEARQITVTGTVFASGGGGGAGWGGDFNFGMADHGADPSEATTPAAGGAADLGGGAGGHGGISGMDAAPGDAGRDSKPGTTTTPESAGGGGGGGTGIICYAGDAQIQPAPGAISPCL